LREDKILFAVFIALFANVLRLSPPPINSGRSDADESLKLLYRSLTACGSRRRIGALTALHSKTRARSSAG
jgi:hypothetical protein